LREEKTKNEAAVSMFDIKMQNALAAATSLFDQKLIAVQQKWQEDNKILKTEIDN